MSKSPENFGIRMASFGRAAAFAVILPFVPPTPTPVEPPLPKIEKQIDCPTVPDGPIDVVVNVKNTNARKALMLEVYNLSTEEGGVVSGGEERQTPGLSLTFRGKSPLPYNNGKRFIEVGNGDHLAFELSTYTPGENDRTVADHQEEVINCS